MASTDRPTILLFGTLDTKLTPVLTIHSYLASHSSNPRIFLADTSRTPTIHPLVTHPLSSYCPIDTTALSRDAYITAVTPHLTTLLTTLATTHEIHSVISLGGSSGTALASAAMQALPLGLPKLIITTMASGDTSPYLGDSDLLLVPSILDIAGSNPLLNTTLHNAAFAAASMASAYLSRLLHPHERRRKQVAVSMFGITTPGVTHAQKLLESSGYEVLIFHATGAGGRNMERLVRAGEINGVLDLTTTEVTDEICGGVLSAGPTRLTAAAEVGVPMVVSTGATDCINFGPRETIPERYEGGGRKVVVHNPSVTLVRTSKEECHHIGEVMAERLKRAKRSEVTEIFCPMRGVSVLSVEGGAFCDFEADKMLIAALKQKLEGEVMVRTLEYNVNDEGFVAEMVERLVEFMEK